MSPDGRIAYIRGHAELRLVEGDRDVALVGLDRVDVPPFAESIDWGPAWSSDGRYLAAVLRAIARRRVDAETRAYLDSLRGTALFDHERIKASYIGRAAYLVLADLDRGEIALDTPRGAQLLLDPA